MFALTCATGGGPAGIAAALALSRTKRTVALYDSGVYRNANAVTFHTVPNSDGGSPHEWRENAQKELVRRYSSTFSLYKDRVISLKQTSPVDDTTSNEPEVAKTAFQARTQGGDEIRSRKVILAHGVYDKLTHVKGLSDIWGKQAIHCVYCHGTETAGKGVALLLTKSTAINGMLLGSFFKKWYNLQNKPVYVLTNGLEVSIANGMSDAVLKSAQKMEVQWITDEISHVRTTDSTSPVEITFTEETKSPISIPYIVTFAEQGLPSPDMEEVLAELGDSLGASVHPIFGIIATKENPSWDGMPNFNALDPKTKVPGLFWAGNAGNIIANVNIAVTSGQMAGATADDSIAEEDM